MSLSALFLYCSFASVDNFDAIYSSMLRRIFQDLPLSNICQFLCQFYLIGNPFCFCAYQSEEPTVSELVD